MRNLTKKAAAEYLNQIILIKATNVAINMYKNSLKNFIQLKEGSNLHYDKGIKDCRDRLREFKRRKQYLDRGLSYITRDIKDYQGKKWLLK